MKIKTSAILIISLVITSVIMTACGSPSGMAEGGIVENKPEYAEIDQRVMQFLNSEGSFTDEALEKLPHMGFDYVGIGGSNEMLKGNYLGIMYMYTSGENDTPNWQNLDVAKLEFQAIFLGGVYEDDQVVMFMGMVDKDGRRVVAPVGRTVSPENNYENYLSIEQYDGGARKVDNAGMSFMGVSLDNFEKLSSMVGYISVVTCVPKQIEGSLRDSMMSIPFGVELLENSSESIPQCRFSVSGC
jgi:hypothetical protein